MRGPLQLHAMPALQSHRVLNQLREGGKSRVGSAGGNVVFTMATPIPPCSYDLTSAKSTQHPTAAPSLGEI